MTAAKPHSPADDLKSHNRKENAEGGQRTLASAGDIRPRDEGWWNRPHLHIETRDWRKEFQPLMHARLIEARNWAEVERLHTDNAAQISRLGQGTKEDVLAAIEARKKQLRSNPNR